MPHRISAGKATDLVLSVSIKGIKYLLKSSVTIYSIISTNNVKTNTVISRKRQKGGLLVSQSNMSEEEKKVLQAKHRVEEAEARNRVKEQKARTHRLIQEGALLESIAPSVRDMSMEQLKRELMICLRGLS